MSLCWFESCPFDSWGLAMVGGGCSFALWEFSLWYKQVNPNKPHLLLLPKGGGIGRRLFFGTVVTISNRLLLKTKP